MAERSLRSADGGVRLNVLSYLVNSPSFAGNWVQKVGDRYWIVAAPGELALPQRLPRSLWFDFYFSGNRDPRFGPEVIRSYFLNVRVPYWLPLILTAALPTVWLTGRRRQRRRARAGQCPTCGYDLRASPGPCPECGTVRPTISASPARPMTAGSETTQPE